MKLLGLLSCLLLLTNQVCDCTACSWAPQLLQAGELCAQQAAASLCPAQSAPRRVTLGRRELPVALQASMGSFHLYSSHEFGSRGGISILGTAEQAEHLGRLAAFYEDDASSTQGREEAGLFEVVNTPGRGRGLVAKRTIERGDVVMSRRPVLLLDLDVYSDLDRARWVEIHHEAVAALPASTRRQFWQLEGDGGVDALTDRIRTNAFTVVAGDKAYLAVVPEISLLNHDCGPNAGYRFDVASLTEYVTATRRISAGTEITISYIQPPMGLEDRRQHLQSLWGFHCSCSRCKAEESGGYRQPL